MGSIDPSKYKEFLSIIESHTVSLEAPGSKEGHRGGVLLYTCLSMFNWANNLLQKSKTKSTLSVMIIPNNQFPGSIRAVICPTCIAHSFCVIPNSFIQVH